MRHLFDLPHCHFSAVLAAVVLCGAVAASVAAEPETSQIVFRQTMSESSIAARPQQPRVAQRRENVFQQLQRNTSAVTRERANEQLRRGLANAKSQLQPAAAPPAEPLRLEPVAPSDTTAPCAPAGEKRLDELGIAIELPTGDLPADLAADCWNQLNAAAGPLAAIRCWGVAEYNWTATCLCHRPLYFEQINLERHGYGCCEPLQPLASAAHFFGTVPALPYLMATECPCECVYTLGHYRSGSCPPWRHHWPPCTPLAAAAEAGVLTGLIFLIP